MTHHDFGGHAHDEIEDVWVTQWNLDPLTLGVYSTLGVGGTPNDRRVLGTPIHPRVVLAGEYTSVDYPATMHGAFHSGERAADQLASFGRNPHVIVIGAGISGLVAARRLVAQGKRVTVLESSANVGGRARVERRPDGTVFHAGAAWIHGTDGNPVATLATENGVAFTPWPSSPTKCVEIQGDGTARSPEMVASIVSAHRDLETRIELAATRSRERGDDDITVRGELRGALNAIADPSVRASVATRAQLHYESLMAGFLDDFSLHYGDEAFEYPDGDAYITTPLTPVLDTLASTLTILRGHHVTRLTYNVDSVRADVQATSAAGEPQQIDADACVIATALTPLQNQTLELDPPLPITHAQSLAKLRMGNKAKVFVRFSTRWWGDAEQIRMSPASLPDDPTDISAVGVWVDASAVSSVPVLCGFVGGRDALRLQSLSHEADAGKTAAYDELQRAVRAQLPR